MSIDLTDAKKKHPNYKCLAVSNLAKYASCEFSCKAAMAASYSYKSEKIFDNPEWFLNHAEAIKKSVNYLKINFPNISILDNESVKIRQRIGPANLFGIPDIIGINNNKLFVVDAKSGSARDSHKYQVTLYALMLLAQNFASEIGELFLGYYDPKCKENNFNMISIGGQKEANEIWNIEIKKDILKLANSIVKGENLVPSPSYRNCMFCTWKSRCEVPYKESEDLIDLFENL